MLKASRVVFGGNDHILTPMVIFWVVWQVAPGCRQLGSPEQEAGDTSQQKHIRITTAEASVKNLRERRWRHKSGLELNNIFGCFSPLVFWTRPVTCTWVELDYPAGFKGCILMWHSPWLASATEIASFMPHKIADVWAWLSKWGCFWTDCSNLSVGRQLACDRWSWVIGSLWLKLEPCTWSMLWAGVCFIWSC